MSDSDSDSNSSGGLEGENEGACGKLLEEIAEQDQVVEVGTDDIGREIMFIFCYVRLIQ